VAARIAAHRRNVTFLLVGGGPLEADVRARIDALGLKRCVRAPGFRHDGRRLMGAMDVFLMTSEFEGLPIALLEAMSLGKPVVSTRVGGIPEVLEDGVTGFFAPVGAIDELAGRVMRLLDDDVLRMRFGRAAAATIEAAYHVKRRVEAIEHLYHEVLEEAA
jgi:glycosyltransferase involved in cell wall biosynthesis